MSDKDQASSDLPARLRAMIGCQINCEGRCRECPDDTAREAAVEIERLRAENARLMADNAHLYEGWTAECNPPPLPTADAVAGIEAGIAKSGAMLDAAISRLRGR